MPDELILPLAKREALATWLAESLKRKRGLGTKISFGKTSMHLGHDGSFRLKNFGVVVAGVWAMQLVGGASYSMAWWQLLIAVHLLGNMSKVTEGLGTTWCHARKNGESQLTAFASLCSRLAHGMKAVWTPNLAYVAIGVAAPLNWAANKMHQAVPSGGVLDSVMLKVCQPIKNFVDESIRTADTIREWKAGHAVKAARLEGPRHKSSVALYSEMARALYLRQLNACVDSSTSVHMESIEAYQESWTEPERMLWLDHQKMVASGSCDRKQLETSIKIAEAIGVDPWFKPEPGLPSVLEIASAHRFWENYVEGPSIEMDKKLTLWTARSEAESLRAVVGSAGGARSVARNRL